MQFLTRSADIHVDPSHGVPLPKGLALQQVLGRILDRQRLAINEWLRGLKNVPRKPPTLIQWTEPMTSATSPLVQTYQRQGALRLVYDVLRRANQTRKNARSGRGFANFRTKSSTDPTTVEEILADAFRVFNLEVGAAARQAAWNFSAVTNATAVGVITTAIRDAREAVARGLEQGEALATMTARVQRHFADPMRAARIAATESSRAVHAGQQAVALATDGLVTHKTWLASSDACPTCLKLNGLSVPLDQHFTVNGTGPYAVIEHAPAHPGCMCTVTHEVDL